LKNFGFFGGSKQGPEKYPQIESGFPQRDGLPLPLPNTSGGKQKTKKQNESSPKSQE